MNTNILAIALTAGLTTALEQQWNTRQQDASQWNNDNSYAAYEPQGQQDQYKPSSPQNPYENNQSADRDLYGRPSSNSHGQYRPAAPSGAQHAYSNTPHKSWNQRYIPQYDDGHRAFQKYKTKLFKAQPWKDDSKEDEPWTDRSHKEYVEPTIKDQPWTNRYGHSKGHSGKNTQAPAPSHSPSYALPQSAHAQQQGTHAQERGTQAPHYGAHATSSYNSAYPSLGQNNAASGASTHTGHQAYVPHLDRQAQSQQCPLSSHQAQDGQDADPWATQAAPVTHSSYGAQPQDAAAAPVTHSSHSANPWATQAAPVTYSSYGAQPQDAAAAPVTHSSHGANPWATAAAPVTQGSQIPYGQKTAVYVDSWTGVAPGPSQHVDPWTGVAPGPSQPLIPYKAFRHQTPQYACCQLIPTTAAATPMGFIEVAQNVMQPAAIQGTLGGVTDNEVYTLQVNTSGKVSNDCADVGVEFNPLDEIYFGEINPRQDSTRGRIDDITIALDAGTMESTFQQDKLLLNLAGPEAIVGKSISLYLKSDLTDATEGSPAVPLACCVLGINVDPNYWKNPGNYQQQSHSYVAQQPKQQTSYAPYYYSGQQSQSQVHQHGSKSHSHQLGSQSHSHQYEPQPEDHQHGSQSHSHQFGSQSHSHQNEPQPQGYQNAPQSQGYQNALQSQGYQHAPQSQGYQNEPQPQGYQNAPQSQGYQHAPQSQGYQNEPQSQGYQNEPQSQGYQNEPQSQGYQNAPQSQGYQHAPQSQGYQNAPQPQVHQHAPQSQGYQNAPQSQGYQNEPQSQGYQNAPQPQGYQHASQPQGYQHAQQSHAVTPTPHNPWA